MAMSEEQKKDLKLKLTLLAILAVFLVPIGAIGPFLYKIQDHYRLHAKTDPLATKRFVQIAQIQFHTGRTAQAKKTCEEFWKLFISDADEDWGSIPEENFCKYSIHKDNMEVPPSYMPWLLDQFPDGIKPEPVRKASREEAGQILVMCALLWSDEREYPKADHIHTCLASFWPPGSEGQKLGADGLKRMRSRQF